jgi:hypothetical protein
MVDFFLNRMKEYHLYYNTSVERFRMKQSQTKAPPTTSFKFRSQNDDFENLDQISFSKISFVLVLDSLSLLQE